MQESCQSTCSSISLKTWYTLAKALKYNQSHHKDVKDGKLQLSDESALLAEPDRSDIMLSLYSLQCEFVFALQQISFLCPQILVIPQYSFKWLGTGLGNCLKCNSFQAYTVYAFNLSFNPRHNRIIARHLTIIAKRVKAPVYLISPSYTHRLLRILSSSAVLRWSFTHIATLRFEYFKLATLVSPAAKVLIPSSSRLKTTAFNKLLGRYPKRRWAQCPFRK